MPSQIRLFKVILKSFFLGLLATLFIAACGRNSWQQSSTNTQLSSTECQTVQHQLGKTCVPTNPKRIVATDETALEIALALSLKPIAAAEPYLISGRSSHLGEIDNVESLGKVTQLSLERILQLDPDLIFGLDFSLENNYEQFSQIAPTVALENEHDAWKAIYQRAGEILNRSQQAQQQLKSYQKRIEKLQTAMGDRLDKTKVSVVRFYADGSVEFRDSSSFPGSVLKDVGLPRPTVQQKETNSDITYRSVSLERLDLLDGDVIFVALDAGAKESFSKFSQDPLWQKLEAVKSDRVFVVDSGYWIFGNILAANAILDDLEKYLIDSTSVPSTSGNSA